MTIAYDGSGFYGFASNKGVTTVAGTLEESLSQVLGHKVVLACAGRTDRGVHALGQVISFDAVEERADPARLMRAVNSMCGPAIAVSDAVVADNDFHARFSCLGRIYRYQILNTAVINPLLAGFCWHVERRLDLNAMRTASDHLVGTHDFSSFCRRNHPDQSLIRTVHKAIWEQQNDVLIFEIKARAFCHQMVRSLVALYVSIGLGKIKTTEVSEITAKRNRNPVPAPAPAHGLILWHALFAEEPIK